MRNWFDLVDEICLYFKQTNRINIMRICSIAIANINAFKTRRRIFCPKQGHKIEVVVLNRVYILGFFCPEQAGSAAHLFPNIGGVPPPAPGRVCQ